MKPKKNILVYFVVAASAIFLLSVYLNPLLVSFDNFESDSMLASSNSSKKQRSNKNRPKTAPDVITAGASSTSSVFETSFVDGFDTNYTHKESGSMNKSSNASWWLSSGAYFLNKDGIGSTILGELSALDPWRVAFSLSNSLDTDNGYHPQNIFRLVLKKRWQNYKQEAYFNVVGDNLSVSPNRNASNGLLFFERYQDAFNLYYTGIRVDGFAVIKKKINSTYYTLAYKPLYKNDFPYEKENNSNLIPKNTWIGLRSEVKTNLDNTVSIKLYVDSGRTGNWVLVAEAKDDGKTYGGEVFNDGHTGIRTDFMDVEFEDYSVTRI